MYNKHILNKYIVLEGITSHLPYQSISVHISPISQYYPNTIPLYPFRSIHSISDVLKLLHLHSAFSLGVARYSTLLPGTNNTSHSSSYLLIKSWIFLQTNVSLLPIPNYKQLNHICNHRTNISCINNTRSPLSPASIPPSLPSQALTFTTIQSSIHIFFPHIKS
jgi:hypothetical protein